MYNYYFIINDMISDMSVFFAIEKIKNRDKITCL